MHLLLVMMEVDCSHVLVVRRCSLEKKRKKREEGVRRGFKCMGKDAVNAGEE